MGVRGQGRPISSRRRGIHSPAGPQETRQGDIFPQSRFVLAELSAVPDRYFDRIRRLIFRHLDEARAKAQSGALRAPLMFRESGKLNENRPYFFLKPPGEPGWLFERAGTGWVISRCEKIHGMGTFIRRTDPWDIVNVFVSGDGEEAVRVASQRDGGELISVLVYEQKILAALGLGIDRD